MAKGNDGRSARHRLDHDEAEWLRPIDGEKQRCCSAKEARLFAFADLTDEFHVGMCLDHRPNRLFPIDLIGSVHLGCDLQRHSGSCSDLDRAVRPFFRCNPTEKSEVTTARVRLERKQVAWETMM